MVKLELVGLDKAADVLDRALKIRNPELWQTRRDNYRKVRQKHAKEDRVPLSRITRDKKKLGLAGWGSHAPMMHRCGLGDLNREIAETRVDLYRAEMVAGRWRFSPDPVVITERGDVVNGQHRLVAAAGVTWEDGDVIPDMVVIWGVPEESALLMDEATRSKEDRRHIVLNYAARVRR